MQEPHEALSAHTHLSLAQPHGGWDGAPFETTSWTAIQAVARKHNLSLRAREAVLRELLADCHEPAERVTDISVLDPLGQPSWTITARLTAQGRAVYRLAKAVGSKDCDRSEGKVKPAKRFPAVGSKASVNLLKNLGLSIGATFQSTSLPSQAVFNGTAAPSPMASDQGPTALSSKAQSSSAQIPLPSGLCNLPRTGCLQGGDVLGAILSHSGSSDQSPCLRPEAHLVWLDASLDLTPSLDCRIHSDVCNGHSTERPEVPSGLADGGKEAHTSHKAALATSDASLRSEQPRSPRNEPSPSPRKVPTREDSDLISSISTSAPTITELIAVLTSAIDNRLMTSFFLTFRVFMSTRQLLDLLIERFSWATTSSPYDPAHRRIVLVRTYAIFKYWLQHFFELDYLRDRTLRQRLTRWLNEAGSGANSSGNAVQMSVIKSLKNVVRDLKHQYMQTGVSALLRDEISRSAPTVSHHEVVRGAHSTGTSTTGTQTLFPLADSAVRTERSSNDTRNFRSLADSCDHALPQQVDCSHHSLSSCLSPDRFCFESVARPAPLPTLSYDPLTRAISSTVDALARIKRSMGNGGIRVHNARDTLAESGTGRSDLLFLRDGLKDLVGPCEVSRNKDFCRDQDCTSASAIGDLHDRTPSLGTSSTVSSSTPDSALHLADHRTDPHWESTWGQQGLKVSRSPRAADARSSQDEVCPGQHSRNQRARTCSLDRADTGRFPLTATTKEKRRSQSNGSMRSVSRCASLESLSHSISLQRQSNFEVVHHAFSSRTLRSATHRAADARLSSQDRYTPTALPGSTSSYPSSETSPQNPYGMLLHSIDTSPERSNIVQIDEVDLSSDEDDGAVRQALRRLPGARDLRMANRCGNVQPDPSRLTTLRSQAEKTTTTPAAHSATASPHAPSDRLSFSHRESDVSISAQLEMMDPDDALAGYELVKGLRVEDFASDEDDGPGDVEEALRRLEGFIDEGKRLARAQRVEALWANSQNRQAALGAELATSKAETEQANMLEEESCLLTEEDMPQRNTSLQPVVEAASGIAPSSSAEQFSLAPQPVEVVLHTQETHSANIHAASRAPTSALGSTSKVSRDKETLEPKLQDKVSPTEALGLRPTPPAHRCFLLDYRSGAIAQHFTLIERELFCAIDWTDLVTNGWRERSYPYEVVDWEAYYKAQCQARQNAEAAGEPPPRTDVETVVARFNLTCNWVASQVVLTQRIDERVAVITKLVQVAFKCYQQCNFVTTVEICLGLQSPWVERLHKTWARMGSWEMRVFRDLKAFTSPRHDFHHLRAAMHELIINGNLEDLMTCSGPPPLHRGAIFRHAGGDELRVAATDRCVPFFGLFVSDLAKWHRLPSFLGSTRSLSSDFASDQPEHEEDLQNPALEWADRTASPSNAPSQLSLNMLKIGQLGSTVKTILAFQQKAASYTYEADAALYNKCLRLRCLDGYQMTQLSPSDE